MATNATNCYGISTTGPAGLDANPGTASFCRGERSGGIAITAGIAIGCTVATGTVNSLNKFLGTPGSIPRLQVITIPAGEFSHQCAQCGKTEADNATLEFRVTADGEEYCTLCRPRKSPSNLRLRSGSRRHAPCG